MKDGWDNYLDRRADNKIDNYHKKVVVDNNKAVVVDNNKVEVVFDKMAAQKKEVVEPMAELEPVPE
jgi:hypothetical protein